VHRCGAPAMRLVPVGATTTWGYIDYEQQRKELAGLVRRRHDGKGSVQASSPGTKAEERAETGRSRRRRF
jgi:hypothetical protein